MLDDFDDPLVEAPLTRAAKCCSGGHTHTISNLLNGFFKLCLLVALSFITYYLAVLVGLTREALDTTQALSNDWSGQFDVFLGSIHNGTAYLFGIEESLELLGRCATQSGICTAQ